MANINWSVYINYISLLAFFAGIVCGVLVFFLIYLIFVSRLVKKSYSKPENYSDDRCRNMIKDYKRKYKIQKSDKAVIDRIILIRTMTQELAVEIAKFHYPNSKHPFLEISTYELLETVKDIITRLEIILDKKSFSWLKKLTGVQIMKVFEIKEKISKNKVVKNAVEINNSTVSKVTKKFFKIINPTYLLRSVIMNKTATFSADIFSNAVITIVGEEFYKLYSKELFKIEDQKLEKLMEEISDE